jgi:hypothetical protein
MVKNSKIGLFALIPMTVIIILLTPFFLAQSYQKKQEPFGIHFAEIELTDEDLVKSDAVVRGKVLGVISKETKTVEEIPDYGEPFTITYPVIIYEFEVIEDLKAFDKKRENNIIEISVLDGMFNNPLEQKDEELVLFLIKHSGQNNTFSPVSYSQGIYKVHGNILQSAAGNRQLSTIKKYITEIAYQ